LKILLDECVDWRLARDIVAREVTAARQMGWAAILIRMMNPACEPSH
jgi:hypothetical protein